MNQEQPKDDIPAKAPANAPLLWQETFKIHSYEAGPSSFATPQSLCRFLQEAASNHADKLGVSGEAISTIGQMWVLSQLSLRMSEYPKWHDSLSIKTWPTKRTTQLRAYRDFALFDDTSRETGKASSMWLLLDKESRRPQKIQSYLNQYTSEGHSPDMLNSIEKELFDKQNSEISSRIFKVRASDIDYNFHVNNVCYLEWALEAILPEVRLRNFMSEFDVHFMREAKIFTKVTSECRLVDHKNNVFVHRISDPDENVLALMRTTWNEKRN
ncbi:MAG: thioesterase [Candidatus Obscuribacterales bacterium]|nr:thioesterase [Candidatus Obscuribacterales bacterium]